MAGKRDGMMTMAAEIQRREIASARERLLRPLGKAEGIPGRFYGEAFHAREQETLFPRSWCAVTVGSRIRHPGDMIPVDLAGWPLLIVRGKDGTIRAFHNVCRHRGIKLVTEPTCRPTIRCAWHSWSYNLKGELTATPEIGGAGAHEADGIDHAELGLKEIRVGQWLDLVFVNIDGNALPFADYIAPVEALLAGYELSHLAHAMQVNEGYEGNWKLGMEGGLEHYHLTFAHPQLGGHAFRNAMPVHALGSYTGSSTDVTKRDGVGDGKAWAGILPALRTSAGDTLPRLYTLCLFPTATVLVSADQLMLGAILPDGPLKTNFELHIYLQPEAANSEAEANARAEKLAGWYSVIPQDQPFVKAAQVASFTRDRAGIGVRFSPYWEDGVRRFQQMVLDAVE
jgi:choline monooxygenase